MRGKVICGVVGIGLCMAIPVWAQGARPSPAMDRDLIEVTVPQLQQLYAEHKYTVTQVVEWYLARIKKYDGIYRAVETLMDKDALALAGREDADASGKHGLLWGVPIVIKANTSIAGQVTTDGWDGFTRPGTTDRAQGCAGGGEAARGGRHRHRPHQHAGFRQLR